MTETFRVFAFQGLFSELFFTLVTFICQQFMNSKVSIIYLDLDLSS